MKKKIIFIISILFLLLIIYFIYINVSFKNCVNSTIKYNDKINYSTNIILEINNNTSKSKIDYDIERTSKVDKIKLTNYMNEKLTNSISKYIVKNENKKETYMYKASTYKKVSNGEEFYLNYKLLKKSKVLSNKNKHFKIKMKAYNAYNLIYKKEIMKKNQMNFNTIVNVKMDKNNFIKEISYNIDNLDTSKSKKNPIKYKVKIVNRDINNQNTIKLPFKTK